MEQESNKMTIMDEFITIIESNSDLVRAENGSLRIVIDNDFWEELKYQMYLWREIEKGKWSLKNEQTHTRADFQRKYGLTISDDKYAFDAVKIDTK